MAPPYRQYLGGRHCHLARRRCESLFIAIFLLGFLGEMFFGKTSTELSRARSSVFRIHQKDILVSIQHYTNVTPATSSRPEEKPPPKYYCEWKENDTTLLIAHNCFNLLSPSAQSKPVWYFLGDSTMKLLFKSVHALYPFNTTIVKQEKAKCGGLSYLGFPTKTNTNTNTNTTSLYWTPPNHTLGQGPVVTGKTKTEYAPYCVNAFSYKGALVGDTDRSIEMIPVEYTLDVELQTPWTNTTQETVALYLQKQQQLYYHQSPNNKNHTACVVNAGMHDMNIPIRHTAQLYAVKVQQYLTLLEPYCGTLIWLGLSATKDDPRQPQRNDRIQEWNTAVFDMLLKTKADIYVMDVYDKSLHSPHLDNIHLRTDYYYRLATLFVKLMK
jgi:hypothetical protein